jgi:hypothetical protein
MALNRYVITQTTTVPAGTLATPMPGEPATGGVAGFGSSATTGGPLFAATFLAGTPILLDTASALYAALSASLRPYVQGTDDRGADALAN